MSNITIDGFTFTSDGGSGGGRLIIAAGTDGVTIKNCIIRDISGTDPHGVYIYPGATNAVVSNNTFSNTGWEAILCDGEALISNNFIKDIPSNKGVVIGLSGSAEITDNVILNTYYEGIQLFGKSTVEGNEIYESWIGIQVRDNASNSFISRNTITDTIYEGIQAYVPSTIACNHITWCYHGVQIRNHESGTVIYRNYIHDNNFHGIEIPNYGGSEPYVTDVIITKNTFHDNGYTGVNVGVGIDGSGIRINFNNFKGNGIYGVESKIADSTVNARWNWWGHASGPGGEYGRVTKKGKIIGKGDAVSNYVAWAPWLCKPVF